MLELNTTSGQRRFAWGKSNLLRKGEFNGGNNRQMGDLPAADQWRLMTIDTVQLNLPAGTIVSDMMLTQFGGICWVDGLSVQGQRCDKDVGQSLDAWWSYAKDKSIPVVPKEVAAALKQARR